MSRASRAQVHGRRGALGFTLIELAVVIAIVGLLLGAILSPLSAQLKLRKNRDAERDLRLTTEALLGFAVASGRLPCPDTNRDGVEDFLVPATLAPPCADTAGFIPWVTLDSHPVDPWGRILLYHVSPEFTFPVQTGQPSGPNQLDLDDLLNGDAVVQSRDPQTRVVTPLASTAPVVVLSTGDNGFGGTRLDGTVVTPPTLATDGFTLGVDEAENLSIGAGGNSTFVQRFHSPRTSAACDDTDPTPGVRACEFDDIVTWISGARIMGLMVQAGQLP